MRRNRIVGAVLGLGLAGMVGLVSAPSASAAVSWSTSLPNLADGTYKCNATHQGTQNDLPGGPLYWQDCTRAVKGGYWQTVTIVSNRSNQVIGAVSATIDSIYNAKSVASVTCDGDIRNQAQVACWGPTRRNSSGTIQARNNGSFYFSNSAGGVIQFWTLGTWFSPSRPVVP